VGGYDLSGHARSIGELSCVFDEGVVDPMSAELKGTMLGQASISVGTMNAIFDNTATTGLHALLGAAGISRTAMFAQGIQAAPAAYDPVFVGQFNQLTYQVGPGQDPMTATINFGQANSAGTTLAYAQPWGILMHANTVETGVNTSTGHDYGAVSTLKGGYMCYQVTASAGAGNITATIKVQDSDTNVDGDFDDLLSTGVINTGAGGVAVPMAGIVALATNATVRQYTRWQIVLGTATSVTFALGFVRNYI